MSDRLVVIPKLHRATHAVGLALASDPELDVTQPEAHILAHLAETGDARIAELHERFGHRRSTLTSVLDRLEQRALITRATDMNDRRSFVVTLTKRGRSVAKAVHGALLAIERTAVGSMSPSQRALASELLDALAAAAKDSARRR